MSKPHDTEVPLDADDRVPSLAVVEERQEVLPAAARQFDGVLNFPPVHPEATALFAKYPWTRKIPLFGDGISGLGIRGTIALGLCYFLNKGLGSYLVSFSRFAMFRTRFGVDAARYQRLRTLYTMGWSVKAFSASVSDSVALLGYTKRWYSAGSCVIGAAFCLAFGLLPAKEASANMGAGFMFLTCFCMANVDIFSEGHYSRTLRKRPAAGPALVSWIWVFIFSASMISAAIQGPVSDKQIPQVGLFVSAAAQLVTVFFFIFNWYGERPNRVERYEDYLDAEAARKALMSGESSESEPLVASGLHGKDPHPEGSSDVEHNHPTSEVHQSGGLTDALVSMEETPEDEEELLRQFAHSSNMTSLCSGAVEINREVMRRNWRLFVYSAVLVAAVVAQCLVTIFGSSHDLGWSSLAVSLTCCGMAFWACNLVAAKVIVFVFLDMVAYIQISGATDSFYMATPTCLPEGPHFTYTFYNTVGSIIGNVAGIAGVTAFPYVFGKRSYWMTFVTVTLIKVLASIFDIIMVKRWNLDVGIPDHAMYIMGDAVVYEVANQIAWIPVVLLFSRVCPRGSESMLYAIAAGFSNMGQSISSAIGSLFIELVWPITTGNSGCDFSNLPMLLVASHLLLPLASIPLSFLLLPRVRICDDIDVEGHVIKKPSKNSTDAHGSEDVLDSPIEEKADRRQ